MDQITGKQGKGLSSFLSKHPKVQHYPVPKPCHMPQDGGFLCHTKLFFTSIPANVSGPLKAGEPGS